MVSQRKIALIFLVALLLTFLWEKHDLQGRARSLHNELSLRHQLDGALRRQFFKMTSAASSGGGNTQLSTISATEPEQDEHSSTSAVVPSLNLSFGNGAQAPQHITCPLPVLHPFKWQEQMGWGVRKHFAPCKIGSPFSQVSEDQNADGTWSRTVVFQNCSGRQRVWAFDERKDDGFRRMTSTYDAEERQNELKADYSFANVHTFAKQIDVRNNTATHIKEPYVLAACENDLELHVRTATRRATQAKRTVVSGGLQNVLHLMLDSTSIFALRRGAKQVVEWMEAINNDPSRSSNVYPMMHFHSVSCCSPGNQIPMYSGAMNGEGDFFVNSEPYANSKDWLWNIASKLGYRTFWSLDNCPDKSARDFHAFPSVDSRVVVPLCIAGILLSHKDWTCLGGKTVDTHVFDGLKSFWSQYQHESKFAAVQFITPHEETEKLLIEVDELVTNFFKYLEQNGELNRTAIVFWSDHGINFGKYASTHDGEIEKMFPFANLILPKWFAVPFDKTLRHNANMLTTPYDLYEATRSLLFFPQHPPPFEHDHGNPPLPKPSQSHIMASFQKELKPVDVMRFELEFNRTCWDANIPMEFCTCIPWKPAPKTPRFERFVVLAVKAHSDALVNFSALCFPVILGGTESIEWQEWPTEYRPKEQRRAKQIWMKPNRDMVKVVYRTAHPGAGVFQAIFSVDKGNDAHYDVAAVSRLDAIEKKCGIVQKHAEHLCLCR